MAIRDVVKVSRKTFFNPAKWLDYESIRANTINILTILRTLFTAPKPLREETFEQAMSRLKLSDADVAYMSKNYRYYALFFLALGLLVFIYSFYILFRYGTFIGWLLGMAVVALFASQAFQYDFWSLQMRRRTLGLSLKDWRSNILGHKGSLK